MFTKIFQKFMKMNKIKSTYFSTNSYIYRPVTPLNNSSLNIVTNICFYNLNYIK